MTTESNPFSTFSISSKREIMDAKKTITELEIRLHWGIPDEIRDLKRELELRRAWIAPIRRIPIEIISIIFVEICRTDWRTLFVLGAVSREWRQLIMNTPQAWSMVTLNRLKPGLPVYAVLARAAPYAVNISITSSFDHTGLGYITTHANRIRGLLIDSHLFEPRNHGFKNLTALILLNSTQGMHPSDPRTLLDGRMLPKLRSLYCSSILDSIVGDLSPDAILPPIKELSLLTRNPPIITEIIRRLAYQLTALSLSVSPFPGIALRSIPEIEFPFLNTLTFRPPSGMTITWPFNALTPTLVSYIEESTSDMHNIHKDTKTVENLAYSGDIDLDPFPRVCKLMIIGQPAKRALEYLTWWPDALPHLRMLTSTRGRGLGEQLESFNREFGRNIIGNFKDEPIPFPAPFDWDLNVSWDGFKS